MSKGDTSLTTKAIASYRTGNLSSARKLALAILDGGSSPRDKAAAHHLLALIQRRGQHLAEAIVHLQHAVELQPDIAELKRDLVETHKARARALQKQAKPAESEAQARCALRWKPGDPGARNLVGVALHEQKRFEEARECFEAALPSAPSYAPLRLNYANLLAELKELPEATVEYAKAIALRPDHVPTLLSAGGALVEAKRTDEALELLNRAARLDPVNADVQFNLGNAFVAAGDRAAAVRCYGQALQLRPDWPAARANWMRQRAEVCDWGTDWDLQIRILVDQIGAELDAGRASPLRASQALALPIPARLLRRIARAELLSLHRRGWGREGDPPESEPPAAGRRLRIGYLSHDFRNHATGHLVRGMFSHHDREKFEVFVYSYGPDDDSPYRRNIEADCEHFIDLRGYPDRQMVRRIQDDRIHILVDLRGFAANGRPQVLFERPAPVLVHYIGTPGTMGGLVDYLVTDPITTPPASAYREEFEEALIFLPHTYLMTDDQPPVSDREFSRSDCGLPESGLVFAAFNNSYKIQPQIFDVWVRILDAVPGSVIWLMQTSPPAADNLRSEAAKRGIDANRLVFARYASKPEHLARHRLADLFLDTPVYCAHTTAMDALWVGVPVLTCRGERFSDRVATSLVTAAGLDGLIARDFDQYEKLAVELATDRKRLGRIRADWSRRRDRSRLFDTAGRVKDLERAYASIWEQHIAGGPRRDIDLRTPGREG